MIPQSQRYSTWRWKEITTDIWQNVQNLRKNQVSQSHITRWVFACQSLTIYVQVMYPIESTIGWLLLFRALISRRILGPGTTVYGLKLIIVKHMEQSVLDGGLGDVGIWLCILHAYVLVAKKIFEEWDNRYLWLWYGGELVMWKWCPSLGRCH